MQNAHEVRITQEVDSIIGGQTSSELLRRIYSPSGPDDDLRRRLRDLSELLPIATVDFYALADRLGKDLRAFTVIHIAGLSASYEAQGWIHFHLSLRLETAAHLGIDEAFWPSLIHALLAVQYPLNDAATAAMRTIAGKRLAGLVPYEAAQQFVAAARLGSAELAPDISAAISETSTQLRPYLRHVHSEILSRGIHVAPSDPPEFSGRTLVIPPGGRAQFRRPTHAGEHYVFKATEFEVPQVSIVEIEDALLSIDVTQPQMAQFYVFDSQGRYDWSLSFGVSPFVDPDPVQVTGQVALCDDRFPEPNVSHLLFDKFPRLALYDQAIQGEYAALLFRPYAYADEVFAAAGRAAQLVRPPTPRCTMRIERLFVSTNVSIAFQHPAQFASPWAMNFLRDRLRPPPPGPASRKIYVSRSDAAFRRILNEPEVVRELQLRGYEIHSLTGMAFKDQVQLFSEASHVVGLHGAGLSNILFCPTGASVLEIVPPMYATVTYWMLASGLDHKYSALIASDPEFDRPSYDKWVPNLAFLVRDVSVDPTELGSALDRM